MTVPDAELREIARQLTEDYHNAGGTIGLDAPADNRARENGREYNGHFETVTPQFATDQQGRPSQEKATPKVYAGPDYSDRDLGAGGVSAIWPRSIPCFFCSIWSRLGKADKMWFCFHAAGFAVLGFAIGLQIF